MNKEDRKWLDERITAAALGVVVGGVIIVLIMIFGK
jgi:hypothetical protein